MTKFKQLLAIVTMLSLSIPGITIHGLDNTLDIEGANAAFDEMKEEFDIQQDNYGEIEIWDNDEIYARYQSEIKDATENLQIDKKIKEFKNHDYDGYGTISEVSDKITSLSENSDERFREKYEDDLSEADAFINKFKDVKDEVGSGQTEVSMLKNKVKDKYMEKVEEYLKRNSANSGLLSSLFGGGGMNGFGGSFNFDSSKLTDIFSLDNLNFLQGGINEYNEYMSNLSEEEKRQKEIEADAYKKSLQSMSNEIKDKYIQANEVCRAANSTMSSSGVFTTSNIVDKNLACNAQQSIFEKKQAEIYVKGKEVADYVKGK